MRKNLTTEEYIIKAKNINGITYTYENTIYKNARTKVIISCKYHGNFEQLPYNHLKGQGCNKCALSKRTIKTKEFIEKTKEFIEKATKKHKGIYSYENTIIYSQKKVIITCQKHGNFEQCPYNHLNGQGCRKCSNNKSLTTEEFIIKAKNIQGERYDYSKVIYINSYTKVIITCPKHGDFEQRPTDHLRGHCCSICFRNKKLTTKEFIERANNIHNRTYEYKKTICQNTRTKVIITCRKHGDFYQRPTDHLNGQGCRKCGLTKRMKINRLLKN